MSGVRWGSLLTLAWLTWLAPPAAAEPLARDEVPEPLAPWVDWVLRGHEAERCPFLDGQGAARPCVWPSRLELRLDAGEGRFSQEWLVFAEAHVPLPGDERRWPQEVRAGGESVPVVPAGGRPSVRLAPGRHTLSGVFRWDALPELLQIPPATGIVRLRLGEREVPFPSWDAQGRLWLQKRSEPAGSEQRLEIQVHRLIADEVPLRLETRIELQVAGRSREVLLGRSLPEGFVPLALTSPLPARLDPDGRLRVQVRPGRWQLALSARSPGPVAAVALADPGGPWDESEVWVFEARPHLRLVSIEDGVAVDPGQTRLPDEWKQLPAYLMEPGRALRLVEKRRGDADPAPDQLSLSRVVWLDFDGDGYTVTDSIRGEVRRSTRLEASAGTELGRVALDGRDQLVTRLAEGTPAGVEVPQGQIDLVADSRMAASRRLPAVGWSHDFQSLAGQLHLPPGWRLLHASGVDRATTSWVERWTLLDLFAVLILAAAFFRLHGARWGALALLGLALTWTESGAPHWAFAAVLAGEALVRGVPAGRFPRFGRLVGLYRAAALALLILIAIPFAVAQVRAGLFPTLERPHRFAEAPTEAVFSKEALDEAAQLEERGLGSLDIARERAMAPPEYATRRRYAPDPQARITTGPGLPSWQWTRVSLSWSGPVERGQELGLLLIPPLANAFLAFARVALLAALVLCLLGGVLSRARRGLPATAALLLLAAALGAPEDARADLPSPELLDQLRQRLLENPDCHPHCAASPRLDLEVAPAALRARIEVHAQAETGVPLPGGARSWVPQQVLLDGEPARGLLRAADGVLWIQVPRGRHQLVVEGELPDRDSVELPLPLRPRRVEARVTGWTLHGLHEDGLADENLQLTRIREAGEQREASLEPGALPPFVRVERSLRLDLEWQAETVVTRLSPSDTALVLELPLLPGESVTSSGIRAEDGWVRISMGPGVDRATWSSILTPQPEIALRAPRDATASAEVWQLDVNPIWHVEAEGIPPVHRAAEGARVREWRPWPGEEVLLRVSRPAGVEGATATIDSSRLALMPGPRTTDAVLSVTLRSSRGGQHAITLPEGAELERVAVDGAVQPIRLEGREVRVALHPGRQTLELAWREARGARRALFRGSGVGLGMPSVNAEIHVAPSQGRWLLFVGGPRLGPAVLFWPLLAVFAAVAFGLGRLSQTSIPTPLRFPHWLLLGVGLTQVPVAAGALVAGWLLALGWRGRHGAELRGRWLDLLQIGLAVLTALALLILFWAIRQGLLGTPEMQIAGNGSSASLLRWYQDRAGETLPQPALWSVPLLVYRGAMLAWALWLALALVRWLRWGWSCFSAGDLWRGRRRVAVVDNS
jgi:hypothetical protein